MKRFTSSERRDIWTPVRWLLGILISVVSGSVPIGAASALSPGTTHFPGKLAFQDGQLMARIATVPLRQVMEEFSRVSKAEVRWLNSADGAGAISVEFPPLPVVEALQRLLHGKNFLLFYAGGRGAPRLTQIWISAKGNAKRPSTPIASPVTARETAPRAEATDEETMQPLEAVMWAAQSDKDLPSRLSAIEDLGERARQDPGIRAILSQLAHNDGSPQVQDLAASLLTGLE